jgi:hypothetical protein
MVIKVLAILATIAAIASICAVWDRWICFLFGKPFNEDEWARGSVGRWRMVDDLIESRLFMGMRREGVIATLGQPSHQSGLTFVYHINGPLIHDAMRVCFDSSGRAFKARWDHDGC